MIMSASLQEARYMVARDALSANLALQSRLEDTLVELEQGIITNAEQQAKIQSAALQMNRSGWYTGLKGNFRPSIHAQLALAHITQSSLTSFLSILHGVIVLVGEGKTVCKARDEGDMQLWILGILARLGPEQLGPPTSG